MKVVYESPTGRRGTFHPVLGWLESGRPFELDDAEARAYIDAGLLKKHKKSVRGSRDDNIYPVNAEPKKDDGGKQS